MIYDVIGIIGVILILLAYYLLQEDKFGPHDLPYLLLNFFGAILVIISLFHAWNLSAFIVEVAWALISVYGIVKVLKHKARQ